MILTKLKPFLVTNLKWFHNYISLTTLYYFFVFLYEIVIESSLQCHILLKIDNVIYCYKLIMRLRNSYAFRTK